MILPRRPGPHRPKKMHPAPHGRTGIRALLTTLGLLMLSPGVNAAASSLSRVDAPASDSSIMRLAKKKKPSRSALNQARIAFNAGRESYNVGDFENALENFKEAYRLSERPQLLFNLGQCHKELGNHERALFFFNSYLRELPNARNAKLVQNLIVEVEGAVEEEEKRQAEEEERKRQEAKVKAEEAERRAAIEKAQLEAAQKTAELEVPVYKKWWFWTAIGSGLAVVATGGTIAAIAASQPTADPCGSLGCVEVEP